MKDFAFVAIFYLVNGILLFGRKRIALALTPLFWKPNKSKREQKVFRVSFIQARSVFDSEKFTKTGLEKTRFWTGMINLIGITIAIIGILIYSRPSESAVTGPFGLGVVAAAEAGSVVFASLPIPDAALLAISP